MCKLMNKNILHTVLAYCSHILYKLSVKLGNCLHCRISIHVNKRLSFYCTAVCMQARHCYRHFVVGPTFPRFTVIQSYGMEHRITTNVT